MNVTFETAEFVAADAENYLVQKYHHLLGVFHFEALAVTQLQTEGTKGLRMKSFDEVLRFHVNSYVPQFDPN